MPCRTVKLTDDAGDSKPGCIGMNADRQIGVEMFENGRGCKATFEFFEGGLAFRRPMKVLAFAKEGGDAGDNARVSLNEAAVEICKAEEYLDLLNIGRSRPFVNGNDAIGIHGNAFGRDDETKE